MKVVTAHQDACKLIAIVDHISKVLKDARPEDSNTMAQAPTLRRRVPELSWAIERFNDAIIPEPWKFEIERRCPSKLLESLKSPDAVIIDLLTALKHTLSGLSVAFSIYIQPISHFCSRFCRFRDQLGHQDLRKPDGLYIYPFMSATSTPRASAFPDIPALTLSPKSIFFTRTLLLLVCRTASAASMLIIA
ncbi:hypothetical protein BJV78DRAFT_1285236 [Lactifluus subvellereus]|nr:hypothetical protein BJV78DRAFT_1285236 [Lactifluus subvellereus]